MKIKLTKRAVVGFLSALAFLWILCSTVIGKYTINKMNKVDREYSIRDNLVQIIVPKSFDITKHKTESSVIQANAQNNIKNNSTTKTVK